MAPVAQLPSPARRYAAHPGPIDTAAAEAFERLRASLNLPQKRTQVRDCPDAPHTANPGPIDAASAEALEPLRASLNLPQNRTQVRGCPDAPPAATVNAKVAAPQPTRPARPHTADPGPIDAASAEGYQRLLASLYFPRNDTQFRGSPDAPRTASGNRINPTGLVSLRVAARHDAMRTARRAARRLRRMSERQAQRFFGSFADRVVLATVFGLVLLAGGGTGEPTAPSRPMPTQHSVTPFARAASSAPELPRAALLAEVRRGDEGQVTELRATTPRAVLIDYCRTANLRYCQPIELAHADPPHPQLRFGLFRDFDGVRAIQIRRDPATGMWVTGDGTKAVGDYQTATLRISDIRFPLEGAAHAVLAQ